MHAAATKALDPFARHRAKVHEDFRFCSPFRLGIAVGESGEHLLSPYRDESRADPNYRKGLNEGRRRRAKAAQEAAAAGGTA